MDGSIDEDPALAKILKTIAAKAAKDVFLKESNGILADGCQLEIASVTNFKHQVN